ncbi:Ig-like domain-containing protein [Tautonia sociabilis]|uniref:Big-1 domain-containing protein n=1 Tax=Tautonia sociabilis TaxID=2080755 RepID=A0A432MMR8_9BACT|nr:Ig-like domain-containing protein [Tautonia sociabilis]RUL88744.1 hypothetical protein TsocGM_05115 [Tautonia sociabilis]
MIRPRRAPAGRPSRRRSAPRVEAMEPRQLLSTADPSAPAGEAAAQAAAPMEAPVPLVLVSEFVSGAGQMTQVGTPFSLPLTVRVTRPDGSPVSGATVVFDAFQAGPSARFLTNPAVTGPDGLAATVAVANGQAGLFTVVATSPGAAPSQVTLENRLLPLGVINVSRFGYHAQPTTIALTFNQPLDPVQASLVSNYQLFGPGLDRTPATAPNRPLRLRSARYDSAANTVALTSAEPLRLQGGRRYLVVVDGAVVPGGDRGPAASAFIGAEVFDPPPRLSRALLALQRLQRLRDGRGRLV